MWGVVACACFVLFAALCALLAYLRRRASPQRAFPTPAGPFTTLTIAFAGINLDQFGCYGKLHVQLLAPHPEGATADKATPVEYYRASALKALAFATISRQVAAWLVYGLLRIIIGWHKHPDLEVGNYVLPEASGKKKLPLVVFSHGLMGNMHMYTQLCRELASYGCVVVALESKDGSATGTVKVPYIHSPYFHSHEYWDRDKVRNFRERFFQRRQSELIALLRYIRETPSAGLPAILRAADPTYAILVGHSFGAAATLHAVKSSIFLRDVTKMLVLYDPWVWPLSDDDVVPGTVPTTCILSESWYQGREVPQIAHALGHRSEVWGLPSTEHMFWSDLVWAFPACINSLSKKTDPRPAHFAMVAKTYAALDKFFGKATPKPEHPSAAIIDLQHCTLTRSAQQMEESNKHPDEEESREVKRRRCSPKESMST